MTVPNEVYSAMVAERDAARTQADVLAAQLLNQRHRDQADLEQHIRSALQLVKENQ